MLRAVAPSWDYEEQENHRHTNPEIWHYRVTMRDWAMSSCTIGWSSNSQWDCIWRHHLLEGSYVRWSHVSEPYSNLTDGSHTDGRPHRHHEKMAINKPRREASGETKPVNTLMLNFQPPEQWEDEFLLSKSPSLWCFVTVALTKIVTELTNLKIIYQLPSVME